MAGVKRTPLSIMVDEKLYILGKCRTDLAIEMGIGYQHLSNILCGRSTPTIDMSKRMASALKTDSQEIRRLASMRRVG
jgi:transcriptional regulator with XRE-family HTH domain